MLQVSLQEQRRIHQVHKKYKKKYFSSPPSCPALSTVQSPPMDQRLFLAPEYQSRPISASRTSGKEYHSQAVSTTPETAGLSFFHCSTPNSSKSTSKYKVSQNGHFLNFTELSTDYGCLPSNCRQHCVFSRISGLRQSPLIQSKSSNSESPFFWHTLY